jgi:hypothetical protein
LAGNNSLISKVAARASDIRVAAWRPWLLGTMIVASTAALLATSNPAPVQYTFETSVAGPPTVLSAAMPRAKYLIEVIATALAPEEGDTTLDARVHLHGDIAASAAPTGAQPFVSLSVSDASAVNDAGRAPISALTYFDVSNGLLFSGNCAHPETGAPCRAQLFVELTRDDEGAQGGTLTVAWTATFDAETSKQAGSNVGPAAPPWKITVTPQ